MTTIRVNMCCRTKGLMPNQKGTHAETRGRESKKTHRRKFKGTCTKSRGCSETKSNHAKPEGQIQPKGLKKWRGDGKHAKKGVHAKPTGHNHQRM